MHSIKATRMSDWFPDVEFGIQIVPDWPQIGHIWDLKKIRFSTFWQVKPKTYRNSYKKSQFCPVWGQSNPILMQDFLFTWQMTYYQYTVWKFDCLTLTTVSCPSGRTSWRAMSTSFVTNIWVSQTMAIVSTIESKFAVWTFCSIKK